MANFCLRRCRIVGSPLFAFRRFSSTSLGTPAAAEGFFIGDDTSRRLESEAQSERGISLSAEEDETDRERDFVSETKRRFETVRPPASARGPERVPRRMGHNVVEPTTTAKTTTTSETESSSSQKLEPC